MGVYITAFWDSPHQSRAVLVTILSLRFEISCARAALSTGFSRFQPRRARQSSRYSWH